MRGKCKKEIIGLLDIYIEHEQAAITIFTHSKSEILKQLVNTHRERLHAYESFKKQIELL